MNPFLFVIWIVFGIGGGLAFGWNISVRNWPLAIVAGIAMVLGIVAGVMA